MCCGGIKSTTWAGRERNALQGRAGLLLLLDLSLSLCLVVCACVFSFASNGPVNSNPSAVEVSAKAGLAGSCRLYVKCWIGR